MTSVVIRIRVTIRVRKVCADNNLYGSIIPTSLLIASLFVPYVPVVITLLPGPGSSVLLDVFGKGLGVWLNGFSCPNTRFVHLINRITVCRIGRHLPRFWVGLPVLYHKVGWIIIFQFYPYSIWRNCFYHSSPDNFRFEFAANAVICLAVLVYQVAHFCPNLLTLILQSTVAAVASLVTRLYRLLCGTGCPKCSLRTCILWTIRGDTAFHNISIHGCNLPIWLHLKLWIWRNEASSATSQKSTGTQFDSLLRIVKICWMHSWNVFLRKLKSEEVDSGFVEWVLPSVSITCPTAAGHQQIIKLQSSQTVRFTF